jgi:transposase
MARKPEIFIRDLDFDESQRLTRIARTARDRVRLRRAGMALASTQGRSVPEIAVMFAAKEQTVRELIRAFNERGFAALDPKARRGSMPKIGPQVREQICRVAKSDPARLGCPFTCWSLAKLRDHLAASAGIHVSHETIRQVLRRAGISFQNTKTWKHSNDPDFAAKNPTRAKLVRNVAGVDLGDGVGEVFGRWLGGGDGVVAGADGDGSVAACGADEFLDAPAGGLLDPVRHRQCCEHDR